MWKKINKFVRGFSRRPDLLMWFTLIIASVFLAQALSMAAEHMDKTRLTYAIQAQSLKSALELYQKTSNLNIAYSDDLVEGKMTDGVSGKTTPAHALKRILTGTGLTYTVTSKGTVVLKEAKIVVPQKEVGGKAKQEKISASSEVELEKMVVTATRAETPVENLPVSVTVITRADIEKMHAKTVDDVLNKSVGVQIRRFRGLTPKEDHTTLYMRGTGDSSRTLVLKDGIPLNSSYLGSVSFWNVMSVEDIEKIEIVRGASSALYASSAMGGVINIITRPAKRKTTGRVSFEGGSFDTCIGNANFAGGTDRFGLRFSAGYKRTSGYKYYEGAKWKDYYETPEAKNSNALVGADIWLGDSLLKLDCEYFRQVSLTRTTSEYDSEKNTNKFSINYNMPIGKTDLNIKSYYFEYDAMTKSRKYNSAKGSYDTFYYDNDIPKDDWGLMLQANREIDSHRLTFGSDIKWGKCAPKYRYATGDRNFSGKQDLYSFFVDDEILIGNKLVMSAGVRYDYWKNHSGDFYDDTTAAVRSIKCPEKTDEAWSPKAGVVYNLRENTKLRASFAAGFKAPTLYHLYRSGPHGATRFDLGNADLGPERMTWSYDVGFDTKPNENLGLSFTFYQSQFKDFLGDKTLDPSEVPPYFTPDPGMDVVQKINVGRVVIHGFEVSLEYVFNGRWSAFANHTYNVSKIKEYQPKPEIEGNYLAYTPRHMTKLGFTYDNPLLFTLSLYITNVGSRFGDIENTGKRKLERYHELAMKVSRELFNGMKLFVALDNLTDEKYKEYYNTYCPPFAVMLGAKYTY